MTQTPFTGGEPERPPAPPGAGDAPAKAAARRRRQCPQRAPHHQRRPHEGLKRRGARGAAGGRARRSREACRPRIGRHTGEGARAGRIVDPVGARRRRARGRVFKGERSECGCVGWFGRASSAERGESRAEPRGRGAGGPGARLLCASGERRPIGECGRRGERTAAGVAQRPRGARGRGAEPLDRGARRRPARCAS